MESRLVKRLCWQKTRLSAAGRAHTRPRDAMASASRLAAGPPSCSRAIDPVSRRAVSSPSAIRRGPGTRALGSLGGVPPDDGRARRRARARADPPHPFARIASERAAERASSAHVAAAFALDRRGAPVDDGEPAARLDDPRRARASPLDADGDVLLEEGASLADHCTLGVGGPARFLVEVRTPEALAAVLRRAARERLPCVVIGKGSNILFHDGGFEGVVVVNCVDFIERARDVDDDHVDDDRVDDDHVDDDRVSSSASASSPPTHARFRVGAGYPFNQLGATLSREGFAGLEFAVGVPGTVGGAVFMNAGADGQDTASALSSVECISPDGSERVVVDAADVRFGYRKSPFMRDDDDDEDDEDEKNEARDSNSGSDDYENEKNYSSGSDSNSRGIGASSRDLRGWIVVAATFRVRADAAAADRAREFLRRRRETQPLAERSVGCVFRNPGAGVRSAGALIDAAGLKGTRCGGAEVSPAHANFLVYRRRERDDEDDEDDVGPASGGASEFEALIRRVKRAVFDATGVELREEVRRVPLTFEPAPIANEADSDSREARRRKPR